MAIREIITVPNPLLKEVSKPVEGGITDEHRRLMDDMLETMYDAPGVGLAAIQIGVPLRIIVMDISGKDDAREPRYFVNPEITWRSEELKSWEEGCLSVPEIYDEVDRPARVKVKYLDYNGKEVEEEADGLFAVCIQHEMDHLEGVVFLDHLSRLKRDSAIRKVKKAQKFEAA
ncbi:MAG: peptide deformylase [Hyphomonadaceae bacterium]|nr:peptide deformylase [Hyphomonadaceae bacterium]